ncbi:MAG: fasciclin domain-containing protein [Acidimicrobiales bacterium]
MTVPSRTTRSFVSVLVAGALLIGACGDDEQGTDASGGESTTTAAGSTSQTTTAEDSSAADAQAAENAEEAADNAQDAAEDAAADGDTSGVLVAGSIAAVAAEAGATAIPGYAAVAPGFAAAIAGDNGPVTAFVPTDEAFLIFAANYPDLTTELRQDPTFLDQLLLYHVVEGEFTADELAGMTELTTLQGETISVEVVDGEIVLNEGQASITEEDLEANEGVIQIISSGLIPPSMDTAG